MDGMRQSRNISAGFGYYYTAPGGEGSLDRYEESTKVAQQYHIAVMKSSPFMTPIEADMYKVLGITGGVAATFCRTPYTAIATTVAPDFYNEEHYDNGDATWTIICWGLHGEYCIHALFKLMVMHIAANTVS